VVGDQIKALNELTEIIARSGATFDVAEPPPAPTVRALEAPRPVEPPRPAADTPRQDRPRPPIPMRPAAPTPVGASPARGQVGWLSDLLSRASREESEPAPANIGPLKVGVESLDAISLDIAGLIDPAAAAEMWDRWRQGDTNAFSRRLYTAQGQQTFDEIRRRCKADPQFRETVTRYTQEFERLLAKIGRDDRDGSQSRDYLLSDNGRVYTMLAHASGRLG